MATAIQKRTLFSGRTASRIIYLTAFAVFITGLVMRIVMVSHTAMDEPIRADAKDYYTYAYNLKHFGVLSGKSVAASLDSGVQPQPDAGRAPGYPLFLLPFVTYPPTLAMLHKIAVAQAILGSLAILIVFFLVNRFINPIAALFCALLVAVSPQLISADYFLLSEPLFTFVLLLAIAVFSLANSSGYRLLMLITGIALGIAALVKPTMLFSLVFVLPGTYLIFRRRNGAWTRCVLIAVGFAAIYAPWQLRNLNIDEPQGIAAKSKISVAIHNGMYPGLMVDGEPESHGAQHRWDFEYDNYRTVGDVLRLVATRFASDPAAYIHWYLIGKPITFFDKRLVNGDGGLFIYPVKTSPYHTSDFFFVTYRIMQFLHWGLIAVGLLTAVFVWAQRFEVHMSEQAVNLGRFISVILMYFLAVHIAANPLPRYSIPLRPEIYIMTLMGLTWLWRWGWAKTVKRPPPAAEPGNTGEEMSAN